MVEVADYGWTAGHTLGPGAVSILLVALFPVRRATARTPLMALRIPRSRGVAGGYHLAFAVGTGLIVAAFAMAFTVVRRPVRKSPAVPRNATPHARGLVMTLTYLTGVAPRQGGWHWTIPQMSPETDKAVCHSEGRCWIVPRRSSMHPNPKGVAMTTRVEGQAAMDSANADFDLDIRSSLRDLEDGKAVTAAKSVSVPHGPATSSCFCSVLSGC